VHWSKCASIYHSDNQFDEKIGFMSIKLAISGGKKEIECEFQAYNHIGEEEISAVVEVMSSGNLSGFVGSWEPAFYGGPKVQEFEAAWAEYFGVKHAITVNSWTSGLICAVGAIGIEPGDEVIVSPWTMSATATAIVHWNAIPIFADIQNSDFCLDPDDVIRKITKRTRAILAVDIFGQSCKVEELRKIADDYGIKLILDSAQAPGALHAGFYTGTKGHIGGFSLNHHKHIHTGEGGMIVTDDDELAERMKMIRNHAEAVLGGRPWSDPTNMIGYNFRLGEIEAAIGLAQLKKLDKLAQRRIDIANKLRSGLSEINSIEIPEVMPGNSHVYYMFPIVLKLEKLSTSRSEIVQALQAEGMLGVTEGYTNLHLLPMYQEKQAYGSSHFPWSLRGEIEQFSYQKGICPVAEKLHEETFMMIELCQFEFTDEDIKLVIKSFKKVFGYFENK
jgi:dTDP-4-amino-4,6-dideoxygalactose transaminase